MQCAVVKSIFRVVSFKPTDEGDDRKKPVTAGTGRAFSDK
jgi:hypothetical protein